MLVHRRRDARARSEGLCAVGERMLPLLLRMLAPLGVVESPGGSHRGRGVGVLDHGRQPDPGHGRQPRARCLVPVRSDRDGSAVQADRRRTVLGHVLVRTRDTIRSLPAFTAILKIKQNKNSVWPRMTRSRPKCTF